MKIASTCAISLFGFAALCRICAATDVINGFTKYGPDDWTVPELTGVKRYEDLADLQSSWTATDLMQLSQFASCDSQELIFVHFLLESSTDVWQYTAWDFNTAQWLNVNKLSGILPGQTVTEGLCRWFESPTLAETFNAAPKVLEVADVSDFHRWLYTAGEGSCDAVNSCIGVNADAVIGDRSCTAGERLDNTNNDWDQEQCANAGGNGGHFEIGNDSCKDGYRACQNAGIVGAPSPMAQQAIDAGNLAGYFKAGSNSCRGCDTGTPSCTSANWACHYAGEYYAVVGDNSCRGQSACYSLGFGSNNTVGEGSCIGEGSCSTVGRTSSQTGRIGDNSCKGYYACHQAGHYPPLLSDSAGPVIIGKGSCNCEKCCECFKHTGAIIPDGKCNSLGECCTINRNIVDGFDVTNPNGDTVTDPSPPSPPRLVHAAAPVFEISYDGCTFINDETGVSSIGAITCNFAASGTDGHTITSAIYATNCEDAKPNGVDQDADPTFTRVIEATDTNKQETSTYNVTVSLANSAIPSPATDTSSIDFCLKAQVEDKNNDVYDWTGQLIKLDVGVDGKFSTSEVSTSSFNGVTDPQDIGDVNYRVTAFRCDENGERDESATDLELGDNFFLCAVGVQSAVIINSITTLTAEKENPNDLPLTTVNLITAGDPNSNTFVYASPKKKKVGIATRLPSTFFQEQGAVTFAGTADIDVGGGRRQLVRIMQEASTDPESANFSMEIGVVASGAYRASVFGAAAAVFGAVTALLLL